MSNLQLLNAILYVAEHGCKWRGLPKRFGRWHTVYMRMNRWAKNGVLQRVFEELQQQQIIKITVDTVCLDSTNVNGALKKRPSIHRKIQGRLDYQNSSGCSQRKNGHKLCIVTR